MADDFLQMDFTEAKRKALFGGFQRLSNEIKNMGGVVQNSGMCYTKSELLDIEHDLNNHKEKVDVLQKHVLDFLRSQIKQ